jgi:hypothetical protein
MGTDHIDESMYLSQRRHKAELAAASGHIDDATIDLLKTCVAEHSACILGADVSERPLLEWHRANLLGMLGNILIQRGRHAEAADAYVESATSYQRASKPDMADYYHSAAAYQRFQVTGDVDAEFGRVWSLVERSTSPSLEHAKARIELAELHQQVGDTFEARATFEAAQRELLDLGLSVPDAATLDAAWDATLANLRSETPSAGPSRHVELLDLLSTHRRLLAGLVATNQDNPAMAESYRLDLEAIDAYDSDPVRANAIQAQLAGEQDRLAKERRELERCLQEQRRDVGALLEELRGGGTAAGGTHDDAGE